MRPIQRRDFLQTAGLSAAVFAGGVLAHGQTAGAKRKVKIGQIGTGHAHASGKMDGLRRLSDEFEVVGVVEPDAPQRKAAEQEPAYRGLTWMTEEQLLNTPGLEAVAVETSVLDLVPTAARCVAAGLHIHLDKPAGLSLSAYHRLLDEATRRKRCVQMGFMFRHNPAFRLCFQAVREGWLGDVFEIQGRMSRGFEPTMRQRLSAYPGGTMFELGCHLIDAVVKVLGRPGAVSGFARCSRPELDHLADNQVAVLEYPKALATVRSSLLEVDAGRNREFVVCGDQGTVIIRPLEPPNVELVLTEAHGTMAKGRHVVSLPKMPGRYDEHLIEFARIVRGEKETEYPPEHDLAVHEAVLRAAGMPVD